MNKGTEICFKQIIFSGRVEFKTIFIDWNYFTKYFNSKFERREYKTKVQVKCERLENGKIFEFLWSQGYLSG